MAASLVEQPILPLALPVVVTTTTVPREPGHAITRRDISSLYEIPTTYCSPGRPKTVLHSSLDTILLINGIII